MTRATLLLCVCLVLPPPPVRAAGMPLERERLVNLEGPDSVGFIKTRFDFQHGFKNETLLPVADLTFVLGVWTNVQLEFEGVYHNFKDEESPSRAVWGFNISEAAVKWTPLEQAKEDWFSLALGAGAGQSHTKLSFLDAAGTRVVGYNRYLDTLTVFAVAEYETPWVAPYASFRAVAFDVQGTRSPWEVQRALLRRLLKPSAATPPAAFAPGLGLRVRLYESKPLKAHLVGDYQFATFDNPFAKPAWGAGLQFKYHSPHIMMLYVSNTHADSASESVFGGKDMFAGFRWSYRF